MSVSMSMCSEISVFVVQEHEVTTAVIKIKRHALACEEAEARVEQLERQSMQSKRITHKITFREKKTSAVNKQTE